MTSSTLAERPLNLRASWLATIPRGSFSVSHERPRRRVSARPKSFLRTSSAHDSCPHTVWTPWRRPAPEYFDAACLNADP